MSEKDVVITYETLFELLRIEKSREDIQRLDGNFFNDVIAYLTGKKATFDSRENQNVLFAIDEKDKTRMELDNIKKILKDIYERREKKIISTALTKARTGSTIINTENMLPSEKMLFDCLSNLLIEFRKSILYKLANGEVPDVSSMSGMMISKIMDAPSEMQESAPDQAALIESEVTGEDRADSAVIATTMASEEPKELKITPFSNDSSQSIKKVRFLASIGEIVGPDLKIYGPFVEGTVISLPDELVRVLVDKKQAETV